MVRSVLLGAVQIENTLPYEALLEGQHFVNLAKIGPPQNAVV